MRTGSSWVVENGLSHYAVRFVLGANIAYGGTWGWCVTVVTVGLAEVDSLWIVCVVPFYVGDSPE